MPIKTPVRFDEDEREILDANGCAIADLWFDAEHAAEIVAAVNGRVKALEALEYLATMLRQEIPGEKNLAQRLAGVGGLYGLRLADEAIAALAASTPTQGGEGC